MQQRSRPEEGEFDSKSAELNSIVARCTDALMRVDADELEQCRERIAEIERVDLKREDRIGSDAGLQRLRVFARVLEITRANLDLLARFGSSDSVMLEYSPDRAK